MANKYVLNKKFCNRIDNISLESYRCTSTIQKHQKGPVVLKRGNIGLGNAEVWQFAKRLLHGK